MSALHGSNPSSNRRRALKRIEAMADKAGVTIPEDVKQALIERMDRRLQAAGLDWNAEFRGAVARVDEHGIARVIPQSEGLAEIGGQRLYGGKTEEQINRESQARLAQAWQSRGGVDLRPPSPREAAERMHQRITSEIERRGGDFPTELVQEMLGESWRVGQPVAQDKVRQVANELTRRVRKRLSEDPNSKLYGKSY